jgi:hypothetical protein
MTVAVALVVTIAEDEVEDAVVVTTAEDEVSASQRNLTKSL